MVDYHTIEVQSYCGVTETGKARNSPQLRSCELNGELGRRQAGRQESGGARVKGQGRAACLLGTRQTQGRQSLSAPRDWANTGQKASRQAKGRRHNYPRAKESRWLEPWIGSVGPGFPQRAKGQGKEGDKTGLWACRNL